MNIQQSRTSIFNLILLIAEEMDQADEELRETVKQIWPLQAKKILDLLIPRNEGSILY